MNNREPSTRKALIEIARKRLGKRLPDHLRVVKDTAALVQPSGPRSFRFTLSTAAVDRAADVVNQAGWDLSAYNRCPVVLWQHDPDLPIGRGVDVRVEGGKLKGTVVLDDASVPVIGAYAEMVRLKLEAGSLFACSVGFRPTRFDIAADQDERDFGFDFQQQELTEWSIVSVPANSDCLVDQADSLAVAIASVTTASNKPFRFTTAPKTAARKLEIDRYLSGFR